MVLFPDLVLMALAFISAITIHECCHAYAAYLLGDDTAYRAGRITLNPLAHIDLLGALFLILFKFGWAKPVPFDHHNFRYPKFYAVLTALAGPASNLSLAFVLLLGTNVIVMSLSSISGPFSPLQQLFFDLSSFCKLAAHLNIMLGVFNLLPVPPLDGGHIIYALIPAAWHRGYAIYLRYSIIVLLLVLMLPITSTILFTAITTTQHVLSNLAKSLVVLFIGA